MKASVVHRQAAIILLAWIGLPAPDAQPGGSEARAADGPEPHCSPFRATSARPVGTPFYDPRTTLRFVRSIPMGGRIILEGDIDLGSADEVLRSYVNHVARLAALSRSTTGRRRPSLRTATGRPYGGPGTPPEIPGRGARPQRGRSGCSDGCRRVPTSPSSRSMPPQPSRGTGSNIAGPAGSSPTSSTTTCRPRSGSSAQSLTGAKTDRIRLVDRGDAERHPNWVRFTKGDGCTSRVGKSPEPGEQLVTIAAGCGVPQVVHEIGHVVGLFHEQSRKDRDVHLRIEAENVAEGYLSQFEPFGPIGIDIGPFDFKSIMLYPPKAFTGNGLRTIVKRATTRPTRGSASNPARLEG